MLTPFPMKKMNNMWIIFAICHLNELKKMMICFFFAWFYCSFFFEWKHMNAFIFFVAVDAIDVYPFNFVSLTKINNQFTTHLSQKYEIRMVWLSVLTISINKKEKSNFRRYLIVCYVNKNAPSIIWPFLFWLFAVNFLFCCFHILFLVRTNLYFYNKHWRSKHQTNAQWAEKYQKQFWL